MELSQKRLKNGGNGGCPSAGPSSRQCENDRCSWFSPRAAPAYSARLLGKTVSGTDFGNRMGRGSGQFAESALDTLCRDCASAPLVTGQWDEGRRMTYAITWDDCHESLRSDLLRRARHHPDAGWLCRRAPAAMRLPWPTWLHQPSPRRVQSSMALSRARVGVSVQVFGRRDDETIHALRRCPPAPAR